MLQETEGIVLRQIKTAGGRRMVVIFTRKFGKISVGTNLTEGGKNKSALAIRPFTYGKYSLYTGRDSYSFSSGQVLKSFYSLGEDLDKYLDASYALELTDKVLQEGLPQPGLFRDLAEYLEALEKRKKMPETILLAYMVKILKNMGAVPITDRCACCGKKRQVDGASGTTRYFSIKEGGILCPECVKDIRLKDNDPLIYGAKFDIVNIIEYFRREPFSSFERIGLDSEASRSLKRILREYFSYHMDVNNLKSEELSMDT